MARLPAKGARLSSAASRERAEHAMSTRRSLAPGLRHCCWPRAPRCAEAREPCAHRDAAAARSSATCTCTPRFSQDASTQGTRSHAARRVPLRARGDARHPALPRGRRSRCARSASSARSTSPPSPTTPSRSARCAICQTPGAPGYDSWVCRLYRRFPRVAFFVMNARYSVRRRALRLLRRERRRLPRRGAHGLAGDARRRRGRLRPQRRLPLHQLRRLRVDRRAWTAARTCTAT